MKIVTLTINAALDISTSVDKLLPEIKLRCEAPHYDPGGGGVNVARVIKRLGGEALAILQSSGSAGEMIEKLLTKEGVLFQTVTTQEWTRESVTVFDKASSQQYRFVMPGPTLTVNECDLFLETIHKRSPIPEIIVASGSLPPGVPIDFYAKVALAAKELGAKLVLDTSGPSLAKALEQSVFLIKPNLKELSILSGKEAVTHEEQETLAMNLIKSGKCEVVIVSLGARGAMLASKEGIEYATPPTVVVKSTVGAGDSMVAGMVMALAKGWNYKQMLRYGIACGTATTMNIGTTLCKFEDVERIYQIMNRTI
ncbi:MAG: 1-phosphofructokinase family hexose kinase [Saprospiraceae bacterium]|nr:1-phosphofructokinase family hexose kinase [Saprospiraceae bacterium]